MRHAMISYYSCKYHINFFLDHSRSWLTGSLSSFDSSSVISSVHFAKDSTFTFRFRRNRFNRPLQCRFELGDAGVLLCRRRNGNPSQNIALRVYGVMKDLKSVLYRTGTPTVPHRRVRQDLPSDPQIAHWSSVNEIVWRAHSTSFYFEGLSSIYCKQKYRLCWMIYV